MPNTIVVPLFLQDDETKRSSLAALSAARGLASSSEARIVLASAVNALPVFDSRSRTLIEPSTEMQDRLLEEARTGLVEIASLLPEAEVDTSARWGNPVNVIMDIVGEADDPILVMASQARQGVRRVIQGSIAFQLVNAVTCPTLVVPAHREDDPLQDTVEFKTVLVPLDRSSLAEQALGSALQTLGRSGLNVHLLHVIEPAAYPDIASYELVDVARPLAQKYLHAIGEQLMRQGHRVTLEVRAGQPFSEIITAANMVNADLVVMTTHGRTGLRRRLLGTTAERLLADAAIPLLLLRPQQAESLTAADASFRSGVTGSEREGSAARPALWERRADEFMTSPAFVAGERTPLVELVEVMLTERIGSVPIVDGRGEIVGIITESDFVGGDRFVPLGAYQIPQCFKDHLTEETLEHIYSAGQELTAGQIMRKAVVTVTEDEPVPQVVAKMFGRNLKRIPVVRDGVPVGVITRHDLLRLLIPE
jgi:nucleotide-binding universal stress UspA family protein/predicted transcriptional regulator